MNTPNNKRRRESQRRMERTFVQLLQERELDAISVTDICKGAGVNRTTFYANYVDLYDLAAKIQDHLEEEVANLYTDERSSKYNSHDYLKLFYHIRDNQLFYKTYFKLGMEGRLRVYFDQYDTHLAEKYYGNQFVEYHIEFFMGGLNAILKRWLDGGCWETPEQIAQIIKTEYDPKDAFFPAVELPKL